MPLILSSVVLYTIYYTTNNDNNSDYDHVAYYVFHLCSLKVVEAEGIEPPSFRLERDA
mgnify:CR=1 FL=1